MPPSDIFRIASMPSIDLSPLSPLSSIAIVAVLGGIVAYLSVWAAETAKRLEGDSALLPALLVSAGSGRITGPWLPHALIGALASAAVAWISPQDTAVAILVCLCIPACVMDLEIMIIPEELTWAILFCGALASPWTLGTEDSVKGAAAAAAALWVSMAAVEYTTGRNMRAGGDIAAAAAGGAWVGLSLSGAYVVSVCAVVFVYHFALRHRNRDGWVPLGPALLTAIPISHHANLPIHAFFRTALSIA
jgi:hypothetical protein